MEAAIAKASDARDTVLGFLFDSTRDRVVLQIKTHPQDQAGLLNGIGGKVEPGETPQDAMRREFNEEAGHDVAGWREYTNLLGRDGTCHCFWATGNTERTLSRTSETVVSVATEAIVSRYPCQIVPDVQWLVAMALFASFRGSGSGEFLRYDVRRVDIPQVKDLSTPHWEVVDGGDREIMSVNAGTLVIRAYHEKDGYRASCNGQTAWGTCSTMEQAKRAGERLAFQVLDWTRYDLHMRVD